MNAYLAIFVSGGLGAVARYGVYTSMKRPSLDHFSYATLAVNVIGSFLIGFIGAILVSRAPGKPILREALLVGFLGGFTTFSAFSADVLRLANDGEHSKALLHALLHVALCLVAVWAGHTIATVFVPVRPAV